MGSISESILLVVSSMTPSLQLVAIFLFSFAEGLPVIGSILPGGTIALLAGSLSAEGFFSPIIASVIIALSSFAGDMTGFFAGKRFKEARWLKRIVTHEKHQRSWDLFDRHIAIISIFGKLIPVVRSTPSLFAAARGIRTRRYMLYSLLGSILWAFMGVFAGNALNQYLGNRAIPVILFILVVSIIAVTIQQVLKSRKK